MFSVAEDAINIQTDILLTSKSLLLFASWDSLSSYFAGEKVWRCSSFSSVSSLARYVVVECGEKCSFFSVSWTDFFFLHGCSIRILRFLLSDNWSRSYSNVDAFLFFTIAKEEIRNLSSRKVADVFKLNDEKWSHFLIDEIFQVAMFLQWNLIVGHPKIF